MIHEVGTRVVGRRLIAIRGVPRVLKTPLAEELAAEYGDDDPTSWLSPGWRTGFIPGLIPETFRSTNRPTFQQVIELIPSTDD